MYSVQFMAGRMEFFWELISRSLWNGEKRESFPEKVLRTQRGAKTIIWGIMSQGEGISWQIFLVDGASWLALLRVWVCLVFVGFLIPPSCPCTCTEILNFPDSGPAERHLFEIAGKGLGSFSHKSNWCLLSTHFKCKAPLWAQKGTRFTSRNKELDDE